MAKPLHFRPRSKYGAQACVVDTIRFASHKEARRYQALKLLEKIGEIRNLTLQPEYALEVAAIRHLMYDGKTQVYRICQKVATYRGDFAYEERYEVPQRKHALLPTVKWRAVTEDVKGFKTPVYRLKKKMVEAQYGIKVRET